MHAIALKILLVEDNDELREATLDFFEGQGHIARGVPLAEDVTDIVGGFVPDVYVIDLNLPDEDGLSLTRRLRTSHPSAGIVITTARTKIGDKVLGYESGADIYLTKPVHPEELMAGVAALGKRQRIQTQPPDALILDGSQRLLRGIRATVELSTIDAHILSALTRAPDQRLDRWKVAQLISEGRPTPPTAASMEMRIARLRKKMSAAGAPHLCIKALHKMGYALCCTVVLQ